MSHFNSDGRSAGDQQDGAPERDPDNSPPPAANPRPPQRRRRSPKGVPPELGGGERMVSAGEWAAACGVTKRQFFRWQAAGHTPPPDLSLGQVRRWRLSTLRAWLDEQRRRAAAP